MKNSIIHDDHSLSYKPTHIEVKCEDRIFKIKTPFNCLDPHALYYATVLSNLEDKHSFEYYMWKSLESLNSNIN